MQTTLLRIEPMGIPPYSARGITQSYRPIDGAAQLERTVNGTLIDLGAGAYRKYATTITCTDQQHPALDGVWPGDQVTVDWVAELSYRTASGAPDRTVASTTDDPATRVEGAFTFYRPRMTMRVVDYRVGHDEWGAECSWSMDLEEI